MLDFTPKMKDALNRAIATYGNQRQVCVAAEELCELSAALMKYARYNTHEEARAGMYEKVTDEVADVVVILHQLYAIFDLDNTEVFARAQAKVLRLEGWLEKSNSLQQSTTDREVPDVSKYAPRCENCDWYGDQEVCAACKDKDKYEYRKF